MHVIEPLRLEDNNLLSYSVKPDPYSEWDNITVYRRGRRVVVKGGVNKVYEATYPNTAVYPPDNIHVEQPAWVLVRPTNVWSMLNSVPDQKTVNKDEIWVEIAPRGRVTAVGAHGLEATHVRVEVRDSGGTLVEIRTVDLEYEAYDPLSGTTVSGAYTEAVIPHLRSEPEGTIKVFITNQGKVAVCETLVLGEYREVGKTQPDLQVVGIDPSQKDFDVFGRPFVQKKETKRSTVSRIIIPRGRLDYAHRVLSGLRATPTTWVSSDRTPISIVYGMYTDFEIYLSNRQYGTCNLEIQPIYYTPIKPPAQPIGEPYYWTSKPYSLTDIAYMGAVSPASTYAELREPAPPVENALEEAFSPAPPQAVSVSFDHIYRDIEIVEGLLPAIFGSAVLRKTLIEYPQDLGSEYFDHFSAGQPRVTSVSTDVKYILYNHGAEGLSSAPPVATSATLKLVQRAADAGVETLSAQQPRAASLQLVQVLQTYQAGADALAPVQPRAVSVELL